MIAASHSFGYANTYTFADAYQDDAKNAITNIARTDALSRVSASWAKLGKLSSKVEVDAFIQTIQKLYGQEVKKPEDTVSEDKDAKPEDKIPLWSVVDGKVVYRQGLGDMDAAKAALTPDYADYMNTSVVKEINQNAEVYRKAISSPEGARALIEKTSFRFSELEDLGFSKNEKGEWTQKDIPENATDKERTDSLAHYELAHSAALTLVGVLRERLGGSADAAINVMKAAGIPESLYQNEPDSKDTEPFNANGILVGDDDGGAGGNYSGTGKLSSAAPKQVIVNIGNLLEVKTIDLLKSPEGQTAEIQNLKEQLAQALIDTVHDFDASWNG